MENVGLMVALAGAMTKAPTAEQVSTAVDAWLDDHPEATTTVQDGAITNAKLASSFVTPGTAAAYSSSATYAVGDYVFYGGTLYRCTTPITTAETWTAAHWTQVALGNDVSDLRSAISDITVDSNVNTHWNQGYINNSTGVVGSDPASCTTDYVESNGFEYLLTVASGYGTKVALYNSSKTFDRIVLPYDSGSRSFRVPKGNFIRVQVTSGSSLSPSSVTDSIIKIEERTYTDKTLLIANIPADAKTTGEKITAIQYRNSANDDILVNSIGHRFIEFEQGTIDSSGEDVENSNWSRTRGFIPVDRFLLIQKPTGIQSTIYYYNADKELIDSNGSSYSATENFDYAKLLEVRPNAKYMRLRARLYNGATALETTPAMVLSSDLNIIVTQDLSNIGSESYIDITGAVLTASQTIVIPYTANKYSNMLVSIRCKFTGTQPTMYFTRSALGSDGGFHGYYESAHFPIGGENFTDNTFRVPMWFEGSQSLHVVLSVPEGTTLTIRHLYNSYSNATEKTDYGINLNGHGRYGCGAPQNTMIGYEMAHKMGYKYCITIPKVTSDGVYVCLHDDDSIQSTARNDDGSQIADEYKNHPVSYFTYEQLLQFDFGVSRGIAFKGERIPKLEDFFALCAKTGMHPMLSCHPSLSGHWANIKALAQKYNVLDKLNIKCDQDNITIMMDALGGDIESYTIDESGGVDRASRMTTLIERYNIDTQKCRCGVEYITTITDALITSALNAGLFVGFANYGTNASKVKELMAKGVTEFTDDYIGSVGLNW